LVGCVSEQSEKRAGLFVGMSQRERALDTNTHSLTQTRSKEGGQCDETHTPTKPNRERERGSSKQRETHTQRRFQSDKRTKTEFGKL